ncbi:MAG: Lrp/AsnC family transcriptional regulator [Acholeplasmatales bacterium]|nr:Lrp/AsnC family transcriptional regulator [Acholeplasmatales bacterium]
MSEKNELDEYDKKILTYLQEDSSISNIDLSKKIGLAPSSCLLRTKNLKESGIIKQFTTILDDKRLGYEVTAFAKVALSPLNRETSHKFIEEANSIPQIVECYTITGDCAYLLKVYAKDLKFYRDFVIDKLMAIPGVSHVETMMVVGVEKQTTAIPLE